MAQTSNKQIRRTTNRFQETPKANISRSTFNRSHGLKTTFNGGFLIPIYVDEALPGDTFSCSMSAIIRLATPLHPVMDNMYVDTFFFAVPNRLLWKDPAGGGSWEKFMGEQEAPGDTNDYLIPTISGATPIASGDLADYMGLPLGLIPDNHDISALPFRAYNQIFNTWFRDQNLQASVADNRGDGPDSLSSQYGILRRNKRHDYFTSALPWPQKDTLDPVTIPLGTTAPITGLGSSVGGGYTVANQTVVESDGQQVVYPDALNINVDDGTIPSSNFYALGTPAPNSEPQIFADLANATASTINELRQAFQIQKLLERDARGGTRYIEVIKSHFGVTSPDHRHQRPEYLGGGTAMVNIAPIAQTSTSEFDGSPTSVTAQGNLAAVGTGAINGHSWMKSFTEHSTIIGLANVRTDLTYQQGVERSWSRQTRLDFFWPSLQHIGEQPIYNREIFVENNAADSEVFGYAERHAEYRTKLSRITGEFRSTAPEPLDTWHYAQQFSARPALNSGFIAVNDPIDRTIAVQERAGPQFIGDMYFNLKCTRPMPVYGVPGLIDHF